MRKTWRAKANKTLHGAFGSQLPMPSLRCFLRGADRAEYRAASTGRVLTGKTEKMNETNVNK